MSKEIIRARDMASALELAEKKLGPDVLIVKSSDHGGHVEIEIEKNDTNRNHQVRSFNEHMKYNMASKEDQKVGSNVTAQDFLMEHNAKKNESKNIILNEDTKKINGFVENNTNQNNIDLEDAVESIKQDIADLKALATSVIISDRLASESVREEFLCLRLREVGFSPKLLFKLLGGNEKKQSLTLFSNMLAKHISINDGFQLGSKRIIIVSGASGAGKTTLVAKIAAGLKMQGKNISLIDTDKGHVAAGDSLRCFGRMLDVDVLGINTENLPSLSNLLERYDNLVIDMPSSLGMTKQLSNLFSQPKVINDVESYLATSCSASPGLFSKTMEAMSPLNPKIALTKLDEGPVEFRLIDHLAENNNLIAMFAGGIDITEIPQICTKPSLAQYLLNELNSSIRWNDSKIGDNTRSSLLG
ncbi:MAG: hypothetical protein VX397_02950 [Pseudomonadota bacterium]|nr:hypothetical protein [Pseudomonadota bacterium]